VPAESVFEIGVPSSSHFMVRCLVAQLDELFFLSFFVSCALSATRLSAAAIER
jgi:hypothetical protein